MKHLSRIDIEVIAEKIIKAYRELPEVKNKKIYRIEPELLLTKLLGLKIEYQHLSLDGSILGMTSFQEIGVEVFDEADTDTFFFLDGKTVLIEKDLQQDSGQRGRFNFTTMHEGSHQIFKMLYPNDYGVRNAEPVHFYKVNSERNKPMISNVYSHIIDDDRRFNAQKFEEQFYNAKGLRDVEEGKKAPMPKFEGAAELQDPMAEIVDKDITEDKSKKVENQTENMELLAKLLSNPETASLLKALAKNI